MDINLQVELFAQSVKNDSNLKNGFNCIGHSQGKNIKNYKEYTYVLT